MYLEYYILMKNLGLSLSEIRALPEKTVRLFLFILKWEAERADMERRRIESNMKSTPKPRRW